jgi:phosphoglycolate phosphatase-like HAD superfamily hydrolase
MLLLFDIDGTLLLRAYHEHREALHVACREVWGIPEPEALPVEAAGRTDLEILRLLAVQGGVGAADVDAGLGEARVAATEAYARLLPGDLRDKVAPGVPALLEALAERDGVLLSLVTGNFEAIARLKLHAAGLAGFFPAGQGGFGSDHEDRTMLPAVARARAGDGCAAHPRDRTLVIGDTPRDIACARADGVRCVAVAGGPYPLAELGDADVAVEDATALLGAIDRLL